MFDVGLEKNHPGAARKMAVKNLSPAGREQRFLITHGTYDPLIPFARVRAQVQFLKEAGLRIEWHEFAKEHTIAGEEELAVIRRFVAHSFSRPEQES